MDAAGVRSFPWPRHGREPAAGNRKCRWQCPHVKRHGRHTVELCTFVGAFYRLLHAVTPYCSAAQTQVRGLLAPRQPLLRSCAKAGCWHWHWLHPFIACRVLQWRGNCTPRAWSNIFLTHACTLPQLVPSVDGSYVGIGLQPRIHCILPAAGMPAMP